MRTSPNESADLRTKVWRACAFFFPVSVHSLISITEQQKIEVEEKKKTEAFPQAHRLLHILFLTFCFDLNPPPLSFLDPRPISLSFFSLSATPFRPAVESNGPPAKEHAAFLARPREAQQQQQQQRLESRCRCGRGSKVASSSPFLLLPPRPRPSGDGEHRRGRALRRRLHCHRKA